MNTPKNGMPDDSYMMCVAGKNLPCNSIKTGQFRNDLVDILRKHVIYMTKRGMSHAGFKGSGGRAEQIRRIIPDGNPMEVVAVSSGDENDPEAGARTMFKLWRHSPGHWKAINSKCRYYCYCLGFNEGRYYGIGIIIT